VILKPLFARVAAGLLALATAVGVAGGLRWGAAGPPVLDAGDLADDPGADPGREVIVTGERALTLPSSRGYVVVFLGGRRHGLVACHLENVPAAAGPELDERLLNADRVTIRGRRGMSPDGMAVLRECRLLDPPWKGPGE
jgi:hypothetical protein